MKKLLLIICFLLLCGCSAPEAVSGPAPQPSPEVWGTVAATAETPPPVQVTPTPTPTPPPVHSLHDLTEEAATVVLRGKIIPALVLEGQIMVEFSPLSEAMPELKWSGGREASLTLGETTTSITCTLMEEREFYRYEGGLYSRGETPECWFPAEWLGEALGLTVLMDQEQNTLYLDDSVDVTQIPLEKRVPVLCYHAVSDTIDGDENLFVSPSDMRAQLQYLVNYGYDPIFFSDLPHLDQYDRPVMLTFDDGYADNYTELFPLLQEFGVKATIFAISGKLDTEKYLTSAQAREMAASGLVEIQSHTATHSVLPDLTVEQQAEEFKTSRLALARATGHIPYAVAYPTGAYTMDTLYAAADHYTFGVLADGGTWVTDGYWQYIPRTFIGRGYSMETYDRLLWQ